MNTTPIRVPAELAERLRAKRRPGQSLRGVTYELLSQAVGTEHGGLTVGWKRAPAVNTADVWNKAVKPNMLATITVRGTTESGYEVSALLRRTLRSNPGTLGTVKATAKTRGEADALAPVVSAALSSFIAAERGK